MLIRASQSRGSRRLNLRDSFVALAKFCLCSGNYFLGDNLPTLCWSPANCSKQVGITLFEMYHLVLLVYQIIFA